MGIQVDLFEIDGSDHLAKVPKATAVAVMEELNGDGMVTFTIARDSSGAAAVLGADDALVQVSLDGEPVGWGVLDGDSDDATDKAHTQRAVTVTAPGTLSLLNDAVVRELPDEPNNVQRVFDGVSAGELMGQLLLEAQTRGALVGITWSFTDTHDSNGVAWSESYGRVFDVGYSLRQVLADLATQGLVDYRMERLELAMYEADMVLGVDHPDLIIEPKWLTSGRRQRQRAGKITHLLGIGDSIPMVGGILRARHLATSGIPGRRREAVTQFGGITDAGTVIAATTASLQAVEQVREGYSLSYLLDHERKRPRPWEDYGIGDRIRRRDVLTTDGTGLEPMRVRTMTVDLAASGNSQVTLELNDVFLEQDLLNKRRLDALTNGGSGIVGGPVDFGTDLMPPHAPGVISLDSTAYLVGAAPYATANADWLPVTTNEDGSPTADVVGYEAQWNIDGAGYGEQIERTPGTSLDKSGLAPGVTVRVRVRAVDRAGNGGAWSESAEIIAADDATPPIQPSQASGSSRLGVITYGWDGESFLGGAMDGDTVGVQVHLVPTGTTVPTPFDTATMIDFLPVGGGQGVWGPAEYDTTAFIRLVAIDTSNNASDPSVARSILVKPLVDVSNFPDDAMEVLYARTGHFIQLDADQINANAAAIGYLETGTIVGSIFETSSGGEFRTNSNPASLGGMRIRGTDGFKAWASGGGTPTVEIDPTTGLITARGGDFINVNISGVGTFATAAAGARMIATAGYLEWRNGSNVIVSTMRQDAAGPLWAADNLGYSVGFVSGVGFRVNNPMYVTSDLHVNGNLTVGGSAPGGGWVGSATSDLDMNNHNITDVASMIADYIGFPSGGATPTVSALPNAYIGSGGGLNKSTTTLSTGAPNSGGAGFRMVVVPN